MTADALTVGSVRHGAHTTTVADWQTLATKAARQVGVDPGIFRRLVYQESSGRANALSPKGAIGYTQLMPGTAQSLGVNPRDPWQNLLGGARYLKQQLTTFGNYSDALRAYNAGPGAVQASHGYAETNAYVKNILGGTNPPAGSGGGSSGGTKTSAGATPGTGALTAAGTDGGVDVSALLSVLQQQTKTVPASSSLPTPSYAAGPVFPQGYQDPGSSSAPAQSSQPDINQLLALVRTQGGTDTTAAGAASGGGSSTGAPAGSATAGAPSTGKVVIAQGANRAGVNINPIVTNFVKQVAGLYGAPLTINYGSNHSRLTVNGTVSDHWAGNAADIDLTGRSLIRAGQDALIAAGMPVAKARRITGGGFNVGPYQIIFNTNAPGWGNHLGHLHVGYNAGR